jgi:hypothetical protein
MVEVKTEITFGSLLKVTLVILFMNVNLFILLNIYLLYIILQNNIKREFSKLFIIINI